jgi:hypothetical protein
MRSAFDGLNEHSDDRQIAAQPHEIEKETIGARSATIESATDDQKGCMAAFDGVE